MPIFRRRGSTFVPLFRMATVSFGVQRKCVVRSRSCADQLFGDQNRHGEVRRNAIHYMKTHKADYIPFMDQDRQTFDQVAFSVRVDG